MKDEGLCMTTDVTPKTTPDFLAGGGEMGALIRGLDWSKTPLGPIEAWPQSLRITVSVCLNSHFPILIWWGPDLIKLYNDAYRPILGATKHPRALGAPGREVWPEIWPIIGPMLQGVLERGEATWSHDLLLVLDRNGYPEECYFTFSYSPIWDEAGKIGGVFTAVNETTERVISERRLRTLRELATEMAKATTGAAACVVSIDTLARNPADLPFALLYLLDAEGKTARLAAATGLPTEAPAAPPSVDLSAPVDAERSWPLRDTLASGQPQLVEDLTRRFGPLACDAWPESPPTQAIVLPLVTPGSGQAIGFLVAGVNARRAVDDAYRAFYDLAARHVAAGIANARAYEGERRRAEALAELDRAKTVFFSNVSHEFRTPLTLILGPLEDMLAENRAAAPRERLELVYRNSLRLQKLVNTLLDFSRIEAGRIQAAFEPTDLATVTADLASVFRSAIEKAGLRLVVDCQPLSEPVFVDRDMWEKIVLNLVSNAFKYTLEGEIEVALRDAGAHVELVIRDTGVGISADQLPRIFDRFHRVEVALARAYEGTGIGLSLVQELVKLHGGVVRVESQPGQGSVFTVSIPKGTAHLPVDRVETEPGLMSTALSTDHYLEEALRWLPSEIDTGLFKLSPAALHPSSLTPHPSASRPRIVLADDNADMRAYVGRILAPLYAVETAPDGEVALAAAQRQPADLVIADVMMPRLDGFELLRALRADERTRDIPIILLSARADEEAQVQGLQAGADDYLIKPFSARELLTRVQARLELARVRREAAEALGESNIRLRGALDAGRLGAWEWDIRRNKVTWTDRIYEFHGVDRDQFGGTVEEFARLVHPDDWPTVQAALDQALTRRAPYELEFRALRPNGEVCWLFTRAEVARDSLGAPTRMIGIVQDITHRKQGEEATRHRLDQQKQLAEIATRVNVANDVPFVLNLVTVEARNLIGCHQSVTSMTVDEDWRQAINAVSLSDKYKAWQTYDAQPDGTGIYSQVARLNQPMRLTQAQLEVHPAWKGFGAEAANHPPMRGWLAAPLVAGDGKNIGLIQLSDKADGGDFTEEDEYMLVQLAQMASVAIENARLYQELREADRRKDEFLATLAHELRNPLAPIRNAVQILSLKGPLDSTLQMARDMIDRQVSHMVRLIDDLMDVSRITQGKLELRKEQVDLAAIVDKALETSRPLVEAAGHTLNVALPAEPIPLEADPMRLAQVFSNLLNNASKYTAAGGTIWLTATRGDHSVTVTVKDTGIGIPPDQLGSVFEMFSQVDQAQERAQGGLGIGLTLVRRLVEMHGGTVEAASAGPGQGSEFSVRLPVLSAPAHAPEPPAEDGADSASPSRRILVVEDNPDILETLVTLLEIEGHQTYQAQDGLAAVEAAVRYRPEVVLLDIGLPKLTGLEACRRIREQPWGRDIILVALTGWGQEEDRRKSREVGFDHHLVKPVDYTDLVNLLVSLPARDRQGHKQA